MKLLDRIAWGPRAVVHLRGIRRALERIADQLGAGTAPGIAAASAFRSFYSDRKSAAEEALVYMDDEDRAAAEQKEAEELRRGGPAVPGFYEGEDDRVGAVVGPTVAAETEESEPELEPKEKES